jgi:hypothetical protein
MRDHEHDPECRRCGVYQDYTATSHASCQACCLWAQRPPPIPLQLTRKRRPPPDLPIPPNILYELDYAIAYAAFD